MMHPALRTAYESEMREADEAYQSRDFDRAFHHLERAHILGQQFILSHLRTHLAMLRIGLKRRDGREILGQIIRLPAAAVGSALPLPPGGNTGGVNAGFFANPPIPEDLKELLGD